ncbi:VOC family protein [Candidatus Daviesbacteria bacterium]|nr:VOC family protein [Candidatus Daviesbacteria bacterium]
MIRGIESILLFSEDPQALAHFYQHKVGLSLTENMEIGEQAEEGFEFAMENTSLYIMKHSEVKGKNNQPERIMFNIEVDDIEKEADRLVKEGVKQIEPIYHMQGYGLISTFEDIDGNYFQIVQVKAN